MDKSLAAKLAARAGETRQFSSEWWDPKEGDTIAGEVVGFRELTLKDKRGKETGKKSTVTDFLTTDGKKLTVKGWTAVVNQMKEKGVQAGDVVALHCWKIPKVKGDPYGINVLTKNDLKK